MGAAAYIINNRAKYKVENLIECRIGNIFILSLAFCQYICTIFVCQMPYFEQGLQASVAFCPGHSNMCFVQTLNETYN